MDGSSNLHCTAFLKHLLLIVRQKGFTLVITLLFVVILSGIFYLSIKQGLLKFGGTDKNIYSENNINKSETITTQVSPTPSYDETVNNYKKCIKSTPSGGHEFFISPGGWYFEYPVDTSCKTVQCMYEKYTIAPFSVRKYHIKATIKETLKESTIFCAADGPQGSISCEFNSYKEYINPEGIKGYIVYQTKTDRHLKPEAEKRWAGPATELSESDWITNIYNDRAYFFFIPNQEEPALHIQALKPTEINLKVLDQIASSFSLISCE